MTGRNDLARQLEEATAQADARDAEYRREIAGLRSRIEHLVFLVEYGQDQARAMAPGPASPVTRDFTVYHGGLTGTEDALGGLAVLRSTVELAPEDPDHEPGVFVAEATVPGQLVHGSAWVGWQGGDGHRDRRAEGAWRRSVS
jgi:hypothetical protein